MTLPVTQNIRSWITGW